MLITVFFPKVFSMFFSRWHSVTLLNQNELVIGQKILFNNKMLAKFHVIYCATFLSNGKECERACSRHFTLNFWLDGPLACQQANFIKMNNKRFIFMITYFLHIRMIVIKRRTLHVSQLSSSSNSNSVKTTATLPIQAIAHASDQTVTVNSLLSQFTYEQKIC